MFDLRDLMNRPTVGGTRDDPPSRQVRPLARAAGEIARREAGKIVAPLEERVSALEGALEVPHDSEPFELTPLAKATFLCDGCDQWNRLVLAVETAEGPRCPICAMNAAAREGGASRAVWGK